jgi:hypothetical protein
VPIASYLLKLLGLSQAIHGWAASLSLLEAAKRAKIAHYADAIAATFARAAAACSALERDSCDARALREAIREFGRITGYIEDIVATLHSHLDGRKLAGVTRRLEQLAEPRYAPAIGARDVKRIERLWEAEGYFRALADGLRA